MTDDDLLDDFEDDDEPDFTALYEPHVDGDGWQMSPRMAWHLWSAARYLADEVRTSHPEELADLLPAVARPYVDRSWRQRFVSSFEHIADRLAAPDDEEVLARCTAEEIALYLTINLVFDHWLNYMVSPAAVCHLPDHGAQDEAFLWMRDVLFEDHDFLMLARQRRRQPTTPGQLVHAVPASRLRSRSTGACAAKSDEPRDGFSIARKRRSPDMVRERVHDG